MPPVGGQHHPAVPFGVELALEKGERLLQRPPVDLTSVAILLLQLGRDPARLLVIVGQQQLYATLRLAHPPNGVDARRQHISELPCRDLASLRQSGGDE